MKIFILSLLFPLFLAGIAVSYTSTITYELTMLDGVVLEWQTYNEEGDKFCTKKYGGSICLEKKDLDTVIKLENNNGKVTKTTIFKNTISEVDRAKYKEKAKEDLEITRKRWAEDQKRQEALLAAKELEKLEEHKRTIKDYDKARENMDEKIKLRKAENEKYYSKKPRKEYKTDHEWVHERVHKPEQDQWLNPRTGNIKQGSDFIIKDEGYLQSKGYIRTYKHEEIESEKVEVKVETEESKMRRRAWKVEKEQREVLKAKGIEPDPEIRAIKKELEPLDPKMSKVKEYVGLKEASLSVDQGSKKTDHYTSDFYFNQGITSYKNSLYDRAIEEFKKALEIKPSAEIYTYLGIAYNKKNYFTPAIDEFTKAINLDPSYKSAYLNRGVTYQKKGGLDQAIEDYSKAIEIDPSYMLAYSNLADAYHKKGLYDKSRENYQKACNLGDTACCETLRSISEKK